MAKLRSPIPSAISSLLQVNEESPGLVAASRHEGMTPGRITRNKLELFELPAKSSPKDMRSKQKQRQKQRQRSPAVDLKSPFRPGLELSGCHLQSPPDQDAAVVKEVILFPKTLAVMKPNWPYCFTVNCTPQLAPCIPESLAEDLYQKYVCSSPLLRPGKLPYMHIGSTNLGFQLDFYLILPNAGGTPHAVNTGHLSDEVLQAFFDRCLVPALEAADPKRTGFTSWLQAMNESNLSALKSRKRARSPELQQERIHCIRLDEIWDSIESCSDEDVQHLLDGKVLLAHGISGRHNWHDGWVLAWSRFKKDWEAAIDAKQLNPESRIQLDMSLELDLPGVDTRTDVERSRGIHERKRARR